MPSPRADRRRSLSSSFFLSLGLAAAASAQPANWIGGTGVWSNASGWSTWVVPGAQNDVRLSAGQLTLDSNLGVSGFSIDGTGWLKGARNGTFQIGGLATFGGGILSGGALTTGTFIDGCTFSLLGGGQIEGASFQLSAGTLRIPAGQTLEHRATGGRLNVTGGGQVLNQGRFLARGSQGIMATTNELFLNQGEFEADPGAGVTYPVTIPFSHGSASLLRVTTGTLALNSYGIGYGEVRIASGATLRIGQYTLQLTDVLGPGKLHVTGQLYTYEGVTLASDLHVLIEGEFGCLGVPLALGETRFLSGRFFTGGTYTSSGTMILEGAANKRVFQARLKNLPGGLLVDRSNPQTVELTEGGRIRNEGTFVLEKAGGFSRTSIYESTLENTGLMRLTVPAGTTWQIPYGLIFDNTGTLRLESGRLTTAYSIPQYGSNALTAGTWEVWNEGELAVFGNVLTNGATVRLLGANSRFDGMNVLTSNPGTFLIGQGRNFTTAGALQNGGVLEVGAGSVFTVNGVLTVPAGGRVQIDPGGRLVAAGLSNAGLMEVEGTGVIQLTGAVTNSGTIRMKRGAQLQAASATSFANSGLIDVITGQFSAPAFQNQGTILQAAAVRVVSTHVTEGTVQVAVAVAAGHTYRLRRSFSLSQVGFQPVGATQTAAMGQVLTFTDDVGSANAAFYELEIDGDEGG